MLTVTEQPAIKTLEFLLEPTPKQEALLLKWLKLSKKIYNQALRELELLDRQWKNYVTKAYSDRTDKNGNPVGYFAQRCMLPWQYRPIQVGTGKEKETQWVPYTSLIDDRSRWIIRQQEQIKVPQVAEKKDSWGWAGGYGYSCAIPFVEAEPLLLNDGLKTYGGLSRVIHTEYWREPEIREMPQRFRAGVVAMVGIAFQEYRKSKFGESSGPKRGIPRRKRGRDEITTIQNLNPGKDKSLVNGNLLKMPRILGDLYVKGLSRRWQNPDGSIPVVLSYKILKGEDGKWRVQITGRLQRSYRVKGSSDSIGIDPGCKADVSASTGMQLKSPRYMKRLSTRLARAQRSLSSKRHARLLLWLGHPSTTRRQVEAIASGSDVSTIAAKKYVALLSARTAKEMVEAIGPRRYGRLLYNIPSSKAIATLELRVKKLSRKSAKQRKARDHWLTTHIVRNFGAIAIEDGLQSEGLRHKSAPKEDEGGKGYARNNKAQKRGLTKSLVESSPGRKIALLGEKSKRAGRAFEKVPAPYTSSTCPICSPAAEKPFKKWLAEGHYQTEMEGEAGDRLCECSCGYQEDRDIAAATFIELCAFGGRLDLRLSAKARRARAWSCEYSLDMPKGFKPRWAKNLSRSKWMEVRDAVLQEGLGDLE